jgi:hypothetical protein
MSMTLHVSNHAVLRYQERVAPVSMEQAREILSSPAIQRAAEFGATYVRLGTGQRVVIQGQTVVTVQPATHYARQIKRRGLGLYGKAHRARIRQEEQEV